MRKIKVLLMSLACAAALAISAAGLTLNSTPNTNDACCDMQGCCKDAAMSCCKKKSKSGKNAHSCCKGKDNKASCCCKGDACPMPNKAKAANSNGN